MQGREYDEIGNKRDWWNNATLYQFKVRTKCIEDQYSGYNISAQNVSGTLTMGENIADNGGLPTAYYAYKSWLAEQNFKEEQPLPGLNHTHDQLFFLSFAQVCTVECFPGFCFVVKTSADKMILKFFDIFSHEFSLFSNQLSL